MIGNADGLSHQSWDDSESIPGGCQLQTAGLSLAGGDVGLTSEKKVEKEMEERALELNSGPFMALGPPELVYAIADPRGQSLNSIFLKIKLD